MGEKTSLYRHYDKEGRLLYVGISNNFMVRLAQHKGRSHWYWSISRVDVRHYRNRETAKMAEAQAIRIENPLHNVVRPKPKIGAHRVESVTKGPMRVGYAMIGKHCLNRYMRRFYACGVSPQRMVFDLVGGASRGNGTIETVEAMAKDQPIDLFVACKEFLGSQMLKDSSNVSIKEVQPLAAAADLQANETDDL
jgi:predicted GIY-YIG superfamily endonuclease